MRITGKCVNITLAFRPCVMADGDTELSMDAETLKGLYA